MIAASFGKLPTRSRSTCRPAPVLPGPAYSEPGMCAWSNMVLKPTFSINGFGVDAFFNSAAKSAGCTRLSRGIDAVDWPAGNALAANRNKAADTIADMNRDGLWGVRIDATILLKLMREHRASAGCAAPDGSRGGILPHQAGRCSACGDPPGLLHMAAAAAPACSLVMHDRCG